ncbi:MAG: hypothetical protein JHD02_02315 [Thermoleophilaceae bacterium]|nr:hypothetical protein [Thermoleophilaceae bacterium]
MSMTVAFSPVSSPPIYKPSPASRVRAFFLTDRVGQTLATTLGMANIVRWWTLRQIRQLRRATR